MESNLSDEESLANSENNDLILEVVEETPSTEMSMTQIRNDKPDTSNMVLDIIDNISEGTIILEQLPSSDESEIIHPNTENSPENTILSILSYISSH